MHNFAARFIVINAIMITLMIGATLGNWFVGLFSLGYTELIMASFLFIYFMGGVIASFRHKWNIVRHIANGLPMWALAFTGLGIINAAVGLTGTSTEQLVEVFKNLALAIAPNILGILFMVWLREVALWCGYEEI